MTLSLASGFALLFGVATLFADRFGVVGPLVLSAVFLVGLIGVFSMPDAAWQRLTGESTFADDLGALHSEGVELLYQLPRGSDTEAAQELDAWEARAEGWRLRVVLLLRKSGPRWEGMFSSPTTMARPREDPFIARNYRRRNDLAYWMQDRLERLSQIMAAAGGVRR